MTTGPTTTAIYIESLPDDAVLLQRSFYTLRWRDMDAFGHVNNAMYFTYFEQARVDWLERIGVPHGLVLANISCTFLRPLKYPAEVEVQLFAGQAGRSSLQTYYALRDRPDGGQLCALGHGTIVWYDHAAGHSVPIPEAVRDSLREPQSG